MDVNKDGGGQQSEVEKLRALLGIGEPDASIHVPAAARRQLSEPCCGHSTCDTHGPGCGHKAAAGKLET